MELEQRVKALEYEVKILKNEIQKTLLEIQEQVLVHYYPSLRTAEASPPESPGKAFVSPPESLGKALVAPPVKLVPDPDDDLPVVRKVSLEEIREAEFDDPPVIHVTPPIKVGKLMEWGLNSAAQIGTQPTNKIVELLARKGILDSNTRDVLLQVSPLNRRIPPEELAVSDVLRVVLKLNELLNRETDMEETLALIREADLG